MSQGDLIGLVVLLVLCFAGGFWCGCEYAAIGNDRELGRTGG